MNFDIVSYIVIKRFITFVVNNELNENANISQTIENWSHALQPDICFIFLLLMEKIKNNLGEYLFMKIMQPPCSKHILLHGNGQEKIHKIHNNA